MTADSVIEGQQQQQEHQEPDYNEKHQGQEGEQAEATYYEQEEREGVEDPLQQQDTNSLFDQQQEFTEQDVLPFLLQAQDIISKLESRVVELETDLSVSISTVDASSFMALTSPLFLTQN